LLSLIAALAASERSPAMIAPLRLPDAVATEEDRRLDEARHVVAAALLESEPRPAERAPRIPAWKAWLFTAWVVVVTAFYSAAMIGRF
jgi:hypothetical protein